MGLWLKIGLEPHADAAHLKSDEVCAGRINARSKLVRKGLDLVIANDVSQADIGFNADHNEVILVGPNGELLLPKAGKSELAEQLISHISQLMD